MADLSLTAISYVVLGLVDALGRATPYEMKRVVAGSIGYFWPFPHSQLYAEPTRLAEAGLLREDQEESGRRRKTYTITPSGRTALEEWILRGEAELSEIRDLGLLQLFFASRLPADAISDLARRHEALHRERLAEYEDLYRRIERGVPPAMVATLRMGVRFEHMAIDFWAGIAADPPVDRPAPSGAEG
ncbi:MAG: PadR family transcriptional regulator [Actinomycetota bacterium]